jgi:type I restriction enzyme R subunit
VSFQTPRKTRLERADRARKKVAIEFAGRSRDFIEFVLSQYVKEGVEELKPERLVPLLELQFGTVHDGLLAIGLEPDEARDAFQSFQHHLYEKTA